MSGCISSSSTPTHGRSRSVLDYDTQQSLQAALKEGSASFCDGFDFACLQDELPVGSASKAYGQPGAQHRRSSSIPRGHHKRSSSVQQRHHHRRWSSASKSDWVTENLDRNSSRMQTIEEEATRLQVLKSYLVLDAEKEPCFERISALASRIFQVPIALVSLVDLGRQFFLSNRGMGDVRETPRQLAFCTHCIMSTLDVFIVTDATRDARFQDNDLVTGPPHVRFYAGAPLVCPEGHRLGTLCLLDVKARPEGFSLGEKQNLREMADMVVDIMVQRRDKLRFAQDKNKIIACMAHDLLTPLSGVELSLSLLSDDDDPNHALDEHQKALVQTASSCSDVMGQICKEAIKEFRDDEALLQRPPTVIQVPPPKSNGEVSAEDHVEGSSRVKEVESRGRRTIIMSRLIQKIQSVMAPYRRREVQLNVNVHPNTPEKIVSDESKIFRSAVNVVWNALSATKTGSVQLRVHMDEKGGRSGESILVFVCEDTGPGVDPEVRPKLFTPFRGNTSDVDGIGLFSVADNISSLGGEFGYRPRYSGKISLTNSSASESGPGSIFWFSIPLVHPEPVPTEPESKKRVFSVISCDKAEATENANGQVAHDGLSEHHAKKLTSGEKHGSSCVTPNPPLQRRRIKRALVIDDSIVIRKSVDRAMTRIGFEVCQATNGMEGLKKLQSSLYDVVFCDFLMPVMDGLDCVQQYRAWEKSNRPWFHQYIIGISAHASSKDIKRGIDLGMNSYISKPIPLKTLKELPTSAAAVAASEAIDQVMALEKDSGVLEDEMDSEKSSPARDEAPSCLIAEDSLTVSKVLARAVESRGWRTTVVGDGCDALRLLKTRNWDIVFLDDEMPHLAGTRCITQFRAWEEQNRVARQNNVFLISGSFLPQIGCDKIAAKYPPGFDGSLGKPVHLKNVYNLLKSVETRGDQRIILSR